MVEVLLTGGANPNLRNSRGQTPLSNAKQNGYQGISELLLCHGADENSNVKEGYGLRVLSVHSKGFITFNAIRR